MRSFGPQPVPFGDNGIVPFSVPHIDQRQDSFNTCVSPWLGYECAQTFTAGISGLLCRVELNLKVSEDFGEARVALWNSVCGLPSSVPDDLLGWTEVVQPLCDGWNIFRPPRGAIVLTAGRQYAIVLETASVCDWRVRAEGKSHCSGALCWRFGTRNWEVMEPIGSAAFRTYVEGTQASPFLNWA